MDFKVVDDVNISKEELDYYENHDFGEDIRKGLEDGTAIVSEGPWEETVKAVKAKLAANATRAITIRVPVRVIERYWLPDSHEADARGCAGVSWSVDGTYVGHWLTSGKKKDIFVPKEVCQCVKSRLSL